MSPHLRHTFHVCLIFCLVLLEAQLLMGGMDGRSGAHPAGTPTARASSSASALPSPAGSTIPGAGPSTNPAAGTTPSPLPVPTGMGPIPLSPIGPSPVPPSITGPSPSPAFPVAAVSGEPPPFTPTAAPGPESTPNSANGPTGPGPTGPPGGGPPGPPGSPAPIRRTPGFFYGTQAGPQEANVIGSPQELYWLLSQLIEDRDRTLTADQASRICQILVQDRAMAQSFDTSWHETATWVARSLTRTQKKAVLAELEFIRLDLGRNRGPMNKVLADLVNKRGNLDVASTPLDELMRQARQSTFADPEAMSANFHPEDFVFGIILLEKKPGLGLTKLQALQIAPYVKLQTDLYESHQHGKQKILDILDERQRKFIVDLHRKYDGRSVPSIEIDQAIERLTPRTR